MDHDENVGRAFGEVRLSRNCPVCRGAKSAGAMICRRCREHGDREENGTAVFRAVTLLDREYRTEAKSDRPKLN